MTGVDWAKDCTCNQKEIGIIPNFDDRLSVNGKPQKMKVELATTDGLPPTPGEHQLPHFAFVDADNMRRSFFDNLSRYGIPKEDHGLFEFSKLFQFIHHDRIYFYSAIGEDETLPEWLCEIRSTRGCVLKLGTLTQKGNKSKQEGVDVKLAIDATRFAFTRTMRTCTLYGADGDFIPLIEALSDAGCIVNIVSFNNPSKGRVAPKLQAECDNYQWLGGQILHRTLPEKISRIVKSPNNYHAFLSAPVHDTLIIHGVEVPLKVISGKFFTMPEKSSPTNLYVFDNQKYLEIWLKLCFRTSDN